MFRTPAVLVAALLLAGCAEPPEPSPTPSATYPDLVHSPIRGLTPEEIDAIENGEGGSRALAAELNGYPGPKHVLDLEAKLGLNATQRSRVQTIRDQVVADAKAVGQDLLDAHRALDQGLRAGTVDAEALDLLLGEIALAESELNYVHLNAHLETRQVLTPHQVELYKELRGYGPGDHAGHTH